MKKSIIAAVILVACLLLAPFGFGKLAEKRVNAGLDELVEQAPFLVIAERNWTGGWFRSSQEVTFELAPIFRAMTDQAAMQAAIGQAVAAASAAQSEATAEAEPATDDGTDAASGDVAEGVAASDAPVAEPAAEPALPTRFTIRNAVVHGPVLGRAGLGLARVDTTIDLPEEFVAKVRELFGPEPAFEIYSRLGFFSGGTTVLTSEGRTIKPDASGTEISYETFRLAMGYGSNLDTYDVDGKLPRVEIKSGNGVSGVLTGMTMKGEGERVKGNLYDGSTAFEIAELDFAGAGATEGFKVAGLHYITDMRTKDDFVAISAKFGTGAVESEDLKNAAGIEIKEVHYDFAFRRLHADTVEKIMTSLRDAYGAAPEAAGPAAMAMALQTAVIAPLKEHAGELLKHDPEFAFDRVGVVTDEGEGVVKGVVKLVGVTPEDFSPAAIAGIVGKIEADFTVEVAEKLIEKIPNAAMMTGMFLDSGYFIREGDKLVSHIEFKNGELKVNGKALPMPGIPGMGPPPPPELSPAAGA